MEGKEEVIYYNIIYNVIVSKKQIQISMKKGWELEKYFKGLANHRRIDILVLISQIPNITVEKISEALNCDFQVVAVHTQKLARFGLVDKKYKGRGVGHTISPYGKKFLSFMQGL